MSEIQGSSTWPVDRAPILLVESDGDCREMFASILEESGFIVAEATNGRQALDILFSSNVPKPCLMLLDLDLPLISGLQLLTIIQSYHRLARIPVIVASAQDVHLGLLGHRLITAQLRKPVDAERLIDAVRHALALPTPMTVPSEPAPASQGRLSPARQSGVREVLDAEPTSEAHTDVAVGDVDAALQSRERDPGRH
jgi:CheY-like chemotaxis protein